MRSLQVTTIDRTAIVFRVTGFELWASKSRRLELLIYVG
jgi:hypothetical protein